MTEFIHRSVPVDLEVKGRTVEAYAAVFDVAAEIRDHQGHYLEVIDRAAFTRAINRAKPQGGRDYWLTSVFYNHGLTIHGTPSSKFSEPVALTRHIEPDSRGLLTVTEYPESGFGADVLEMIRDGRVKGQSFTGPIMRSNPDLRRGQMHRPSAGKLPTVRRLELGLKEYGPTPMPAYVDAEILGVRSEDLAEAIRSALLSVAPGLVQDQDSTDGDAAPDEALVADGSPSEEERPAQQIPFSRHLEVLARSRGIRL